MSIQHSDSGNTDSENHLFGHSVLENQIQKRSRAMSLFKDFPGLENLDKNSRTFKHPQQPCRKYAEWSLGSGIGR